MSLRTTLRISQVHRFVGRFAYASRMLFTRPAARAAIAQRGTQSAVRDMVDELICWFEIVGSQVARHDFEIVARTAPPAQHT
jgi:hypothetical protein